MQGRLIGTASAYLGALPLLLALAVVVASRVMRG